jgi:hypothetical protein
MKLSLCALALCASASLSAAGFLTVNGKTVQLTHVYAYTAPQTFDSAKQGTYILAADRELAPAVRTEPDAVRSLVWDKKLHAVELELTGDGASWMLKTSLTDMSISSSRSPNPFPIQIANGRVTGSVKLEKPSSIGDVTYDFAFDIDAPLEKQHVEPEPTAADRKAAATAASAKAYLEYQKVLAKGDIEKLLKMVDEEKAAQARKDPDFPKMLKFIQSMQPKGIVVLKAAETADAATLITEGKEDGVIMRGKVTMKKVNGDWRVEKESWKMGAK